MRIAITGGSGSLGRALITEFTGFADRIVTFSRDEQKRARLAADFAWHPGTRVFGGDIRDRDRLVDIFRGCEVVIHAAARKVVTAHPDEAEEMLKTNVLGTINVVEAAAAAGVSKLLVISSDKAVRAENFYGVSKAAAETMALHANARTYPRGLRISVLRYGNVLASTGSVLQVWRKALADNAPVQISHGGMTRFWLTLPQAVQHVRWALDRMRGGEVIAPALPAAPLIIVAGALGVSPLDVRVCGIREGGEKMHEEMLSASEVRRARFIKHGTLPSGPYQTVPAGYFVVPPYPLTRTWDASEWLGEKVPDDLRYDSATWGWQIGEDEMRALIATV